MTLQKIHEKTDSSSGGVSSESLHFSQASRCRQCPCSVDSTEQKAEDPCEITGYVKAGELVTTVQAEQALRGVVCCLGLCALKDWPLGNGVSLIILSSELKDDQL